MDGSAEIILTVSTRQGMCSVFPLSSHLFPLRLLIRSRHPQGDVGLFFRANGLLSFCPDDFILIIGPVGAEVGEG